MKQRLRRMLKAAVITGLIGLVVWLLLPRPELYPPDLTWSRAVMDRNGHLIHLSTTTDHRYRLKTTLAEVSPDWVEATMMKEDRWFRWHPGVNPVALMRASWGMLTRRPAGGASTLTMQVARLRWGIDSSRIPGKLQQMFRAIQLERHYSKDEILEVYFNLAPYGGNVEGAGAAALLWCDRRAAEVSRREAIALSLIPQSPASRYPRFPRDQERMAAAQQRLTDLLETHAELRKDPLSREFVLSPSGAPPHEAPHFCRRVMRSRDESVIHSTLDLDLQRRMEQGINDELERLSELGIANACAVLVHAPSREIRAYVGSADYHDAGIQGMVDGVRALRSPGSALKPFIYGLAIDQGLIHPHSLLSDGPMNFRDYNPENYERQFLGPIHADEALVRSRNIPAVDLANRLSRGGLYGLLANNGVPLNHPPSYYGLAISLGGFGISPEQMAVLYAGLADDGYAVPLIDSRDGRRQPPFSNKPMLTPQARFLVLDMLRDAGAYGLDDGWLRSDPTIAFKTGTSHGFRDAWVAAVRGDYVMVLWLGNFNGRGNNALVARSCAVPMMAGLFSRLQLPDQVAAAPEGLRKTTLCTLSGDLPGPWCQHTRDGWFIPGVSPISICAIHREVLVDGSTGLRVLRDDGRPGLRREVHEFWTPDQLELFRLAGLPRRLPPVPEHGTDTLAGLNHGEPPRILSPLLGRTYRVGDGEEGIPLKAKGAAGVRAFYWFSGDAFIGHCAPGDALAWKASPGKHELRLVDDHGRAVGTTVKIER